MALLNRLREQRKSGEKETAPGILAALFLVVLLSPPMAKKSRRVRRARRRKANHGRKPNAGRG